MIFKNLTVMALNGRRIFDTWYKTRRLLESGVVDLRPLITCEMGLQSVAEAMALLSSGNACKIILRPKRVAEVSEAPAAAREQPDANVRGQVIHP